MPGVWTCDAAFSKSSDADLCMCVITVQPSNAHIWKKEESLCKLILILVINKYIEMSFMSDGCAEFHLFSLAPDHNLPLCLWPRAGRDPEMLGRQEGLHGPSCLRPPGYLETPLVLLFWSFISNLEVSLSQQRYKRKIRQRAHSVQI